MPLAGRGQSIKTPVNAASQRFIIRGRDHGGAVAEFHFSALEKFSPGCESRFTWTLLLTMTDRLMLAGDCIVRRRD